MLVIPDKLAVDPEGLTSVVVEATEEVRVLPTLPEVMEETGPPGCNDSLEEEEGDDDDDMVMVPVAVGVDVSVSGAVKPGDERETLVRGIETRASSFALASRPRFAA